MNKHSQDQTDRVRRHTHPEILRKIDRDLENSIRFYATQPERVITARIQELEREWDMERLLETNASTLALTGAILGLTVNRKWLLLTCGVLGFLLQHATTGWCPPIPALRRLGIRTQSEIDREKFALKALRGDFHQLPAAPETQNEFPAGKIFNAVNA